MSDIKMKVVSKQEYVLIEFVQEQRSGPSGCAHVLPEASPNFALVCPHNDVKMSHGSLLGQQSPVSPFSILCEYLNSLFVGFVMLIVC